LLKREAQAGVDTTFPLLLLLLLFVVAVVVIVVCCCCDRASKDTAQAGVNTRDDTHWNPKERVRIPMDEKKNQVHTSIKAYIDPLHQWLCLLLLHTRKYHRMNW
jgi:hypothetical protein